MNKKNLLLASIILNVGLLVLIFVVKGNVSKQATERVSKAQAAINYEKAQIMDNIRNNNILWILIDSTWKSPDKSRAFVKRLADAQRLPRCNGKDCKGTEDEARLRTDIVNTAQERSITVGWGSGKGKIKYSFKVIYDQKDKFVAIDTNDLLGKTSNEDIGAGEEADGEEPAAEATE